MNEIQTPYPTGFTLYAVILNSVGQIWNGSAFVTIAGANWGSYAISLTQASSAPIYEANFPTAISGGLYSVLIYKRLGGSPATTDTLVSSGSIGWGGGPVSSPSVVSVIGVNAGGTFSITQGFDYFAVDGESIDFLDSNNVWPDLTGASVSLELLPVGTSGPLNVPQTFTLSTVVTSGTGKKVRWEPSKTVTLGLGVWTYRYRLFTVLTDSHTVDLGAGVGYVKQL